MLAGYFTRKLKPFLDIHVSAWKNEHSNLKKSKYLEITKLYKEEY